MKVVVQIPAYREGRTVFETASEVSDQHIPDGVDVDFQAWVTLSPPDRELCDTWQNAMAAEGVEVYEAPIGKLSARNAAHNYALDEGYDVIFSWDADAPPLHGYVLYEMIEAFNQTPRPVAVNSRPLSSSDGLLGLLIDAGAALEDAVTPHMNGQCHAMTADAWASAGPFNEDIDQTHLPTIRAEEEFAFYRRLSDLGTVVHHPDATVYNDTRRHRESLPFSSGDFKSNRVGTFEKGENRVSGCGCGE